MVGANEQGESKFLCLNVGQTKNKTIQKRNRFFEGCFFEFWGFFRSKNCRHLIWHFLTIFLVKIIADIFYSEGEVGRDNKQKLELAKKMAEKINARKGDGKQSESQATAEAVMKGLAVKPAAAPTVSNKLLADQIAAKLNAKLGHVPMDRNETEQQAQVRNHKYFSKILWFFCSRPYS